MPFRVHRARSIGDENAPERPLASVATSYKNCRPWGDGSRGALQPVAASCSGVEGGQSNARTKTWKEKSTYVVSIRGEMTQRRLEIVVCAERGDDGRQHLVRL